MKRYKLDLSGLWGDLFGKHVMIAYTAGVYWRGRYPHVDSKEPYPFYQAIVRELQGNHRGIADPWYVFYASSDPKKNFQVSHRFHLVDIPIPMAKAFAPGSVWQGGKCIHSGRFEGNLKLCVSKSKPKSVVSLLDLRNRPIDEFRYKSMLPWLDQGISGGMARYTLANTRLFKLKGIDAESDKAIVCYLPMMELARFLFMRSSFMNISLFDSSLIADGNALNPSRFRKLERKEIELETPGYDPNIPIFWMYRNFADSDAFVLERLWRESAWRKAAFSIASSVKEDRSDMIRFVNMFWPWEGDGDVHFVLNAVRLNEDGNAWIAPRILEVEEHPPYESQFELWTTETGKKVHPDDDEKHVPNKGEQLQDRRSSSWLNQDEVSDEMNMEEQPHNESLPLPVELEDPDALGEPSLMKRKVKGRNARLIEKRSEEIGERARKRSLSPHVPQGVDDGEKPHPASVKWSDVHNQSERLIELAKGVVEAANKSGARVRFVREVDRGKFVLREADERLLYDPNELARCALIPMTGSTKKVHGRCKIGSYKTAKPRLIAFYAMESMGRHIIVFMPVASDKRTFSVRVGLTNDPWDESDIRRFLESFCRKKSRIDEVMEDSFPAGHDRVNFVGDAVSDRLEAKLLERL